MLNKVAVSLILFLGLEAAINTVMRLILFVLLTSFISLQATTVQAASLQQLPNKGLEIYVRALNKLTATSETLVLHPNRPVLWKSLQIMARTCYKSEAFEAEETAAFVEVDDMRYNKPQFLFSGWMFASSPAISAIDHGQYDISLLKCSIAEADKTP